MLSIRHCEEAEPTKQSRTDVLISGLLRLKPRNDGKKSAPLLAKVLWPLTIAVIFFAVPASAQQSLSVTVTPPLIQLTIGPGETWRSSLKIVNTNADTVTYYSQLMDMQASDESGHSSFTPIAQGGQDTLAHWIDIPQEPLVVGARTSAELPFTVRIPENAPPGGHYAAILVGTQPGEITGSGLRVSSYVSTLIFVRIKGDVMESGRIREFVTGEDLYQKPHADFLVRFENTGNTHLRPAGSVEIYNMWGKLRGKVDIAQDSTFGNVLPNSIRRFNFSWDGEDSIFDIGRYSARVTLAYGDGGKQSASATTYFWIVPVVPVAITLGSLLAFLVLITWLIRRYIRRALQLERQKFGYSQPQTPARAPVQHASTMHALIEPIREGVVDLRSMAKSQPRSPQDEVSQASPVATYQRLTFWQFLNKYRLFILFVAVVIVGGLGAWRYFDSTQKPQRSFQVTDVQIQIEDAPAQ